MPKKQRTITSMYHRRLVLIASMMLIVGLVLGIQLVRLLVVEGETRREWAERSLHRRTILPTYRGSIVDRNGLKLAVDRPGYAIAVNYDVINGTWVRSEAWAAARKAMGTSRWLSASSEAREDAAGPWIPEFQARHDRLMSEIRLLGEIDGDGLDQRLDAIRAEVTRTRAAVWANRLEAELRQYGGDRETYKFRPGPIREEKSAHTVLSPVSDKVAFRFRALAHELPDMFEVREARRRRYPWSLAEVTLERASLPRPLRRVDPVVLPVAGVADHLLGEMREVQREDVQERPFRDPVSGEIDLRGYRPVGDEAGKNGLERAYEAELRGSRGQIERRIDTGAEVRTSPSPGRDLTLTLDVRLQARIQGILSHEYGLTVVQPFHRNARLPTGWPLNSAAVVLEVETGEILALVSMPTRAMGRAMDPMRQAIDHPWVNRPVEGIYPPGSIIKPIVLCAAAAYGVHSIGDSITCTGHYFPGDKDHARCWIFREHWGFTTHGALRTEEALARSCNIFFYTLADRIGIDRLIEWFGRFGLGRALNVGLGYQHTTLTKDQKLRVVFTGESGGSLPSARYLAESRKQGRIQYDTIILGIGQGRITWTPLQAANAFAMLARGGVYRRATLLADADRHDRDADPPPLSIPPAATAAALEGLRRAVMEDFGTGNHITYDDGSRERIFNADRVTVWGKTGTAQAPPLRIEDTNGDGVINSKDDGISHLDHAWTVGLVGPDDSEQPMFAIAVLVEYGGSGGRVAGPIANQIIRALQIEGYLPGVETVTARAGD